MAHELLLAEHGTTQAHHFDKCPVCEYMTATHTLHKLRAHVPGCMQTAISRELDEEVVKLFNCRGCPYHGCSTSSFKDMKAIKKHIGVAHPRASIECGITKADGSKCAWRARQDPSSHADSADVAMLGVHRGHCHALPARAPSTCSYDEDGDVWLLGAVEVASW